MRFARVEDLLGRDIVDEVQRAVSNAYQTRGADHEAFCALRELLVGMLAALVTSERHLLVAQQLAAEDAAHLNALVRKVQEISMPPTTAAAHPATERGLPLRPPTETVAADRGRRALSGSPRRGTHRINLARGAPLAQLPDSTGARPICVTCAAPAEAPAEVVDLCRERIASLRRRIDDTYTVVSRSRALLAAARMRARSFHSAG
jgi:hypothetical protein